MGGFQPMMRTITQMIMGERKGRTGEMIPIHWTEAVGGFLQNKLAPIPVFALDLIRGETAVGDPVNLTVKDTAARAVQNLTFLWIQDLFDAIRYQGLATGAIVAPATFIGLGASTYPMSPSTKVALQKDEITRQTLGKKWVELGPEAQDFMRKQFSEITEWEREADLQQNSPRLAMRRVQKLAKTRIEMHDQLPNDVSLELDSLGVDNYGVDETMGHKWRIGRERFKEYKTTVVDVVTSATRQLMAKPEWTSITPESRKNLLEGLINKTKATVRKHIIQKANYKDLEYMVETEE
jgi:hypothetical protein